MTGTQIARLFLQNEKFMDRWRKVTSELRLLGFENLMRRLGEPETIALDHPLHAQVAAFSQAELRGWHAAIDAFFDLPEAVLKRPAEAATFDSPDFGAEEMMLSLGYGTKENTENREE